MFCFKESMLNQILYSKKNHERSIRYGWPGTTGSLILVLSIESNEYFIQSLQTVKRFVEDTSYGFYSLTNEVKPRRRRMQPKNCRETLQLLNLTPI